MAITLEDFKKAFTSDLQENMLSYIEENKETESLIEFYIDGVFSRKHLEEYLLPLIDTNKFLLENSNNLKMGQIFVDFINNLEKEKKSLRSTSTLPRIEAIETYISEDSYAEQFEIINKEQTAQEMIKEIAIKNFSLKEIGFTKKTYMENEAYDYLKNTVKQLKNNTEEINFLSIKDLESEEDRVLNHSGLNIYEVVENYKGIDSFLKLIKKLNLFFELFMVVKEENVENSKIMKEVREKLNSTLDNNEDISFVIFDLIEESSFINGVFHQNFFKEISEKIGAKHGELIVTHFSSDIYQNGDDSYLLRAALRQVITDNKINTKINFSESDDKYLLSLHNNAVLFLLQEFIMENNSDLISGIKLNEKYNDGKLSYRLDNKDSMFIFPKEIFKDLTKKKSINLILESMKEIVNQSLIENNLCLSSEGGSIKLSEILKQSYRRDYLLENLNGDKNIIKNKKKV